jgi:hypothetical protein
MVHLARILLLTIGVFFASITKAQSPYYHYFTDSIQPGYRISGAFDSTDLNVAPYQHTLPLSFSPTVGLFDYSTMNQTRHPQFRKRFSAIPHVGLIYAMGSNATQIGRISYTQTLDTGVYVQLDYQRSTSNGAMRNSNFEENTLEIYLAIVRTRLAATLHIYYNGGSRAFNGGLVGDSLSNAAFDLIFQEVNKGNNFSNATFNANLGGATFDTYRQFQVNSENYWSFIKKTTIKTGLFIHPTLDISNRKYVENADIAAIYQQVNYDSTKTRDFYQLSQARLFGGYFIHSKHIAFNAGLQGNYWDYDNLGHSHDTLELSIKSDLLFNLNSGWKWSSAGQLNIAGALGAFQFNSQIKKEFRQVGWNIFGAINRSYPLQNQRYYYGNAVAYAWDVKQLSTISVVGAELHSKFRFGQVRLQSSFSNYANLPVWIENKWRQDTLNALSIGAVSLQTAFRMASFFIQPTVIYQVSNLNVIPPFTAFARLGYNGTIFKAKKLKTCLGLEMGYISSYRLMDFVPQLATYSFSSSQQRFVAMPKLHAFSTFDLGYFRWFIRAENLEQLALKKVNMEALGYAVVPFQLRFGVSWDLFN